MTIHELLESKGPYVVADEMQYLIQHHTGIKLPYLEVLNATFDIQFGPKEDIALEDFIRYVIVAMHERNRTGYIDMP